MIILNLGCGSKTSSHADVVNIDWSVLLRVKRHKVLHAMVRRMLGRDRRDTLDAVPDNILVHDLASGIPFSSSSVDVVYHSHLLEHFDRNVGECFLEETKRVLRPGGIHRIVVPDFESRCRSYLNHIYECDEGHGQPTEHDYYIAEVIEQSVRREAFGSSQQNRVRRSLENRFFGDARKRGETHQWMYDRISLGVKLAAAGYRDVEVHQFNTSAIRGWNEIGLDLDDNDKQYKVDSLYIEATA